MEAKDIIKKRFGSHNRLYSKYDPKIPESAEREYVRLTNGYMELLKDELERSLPQLKEIYRKELIENDDFRQNQHFDSASTLQLAIEKMFQQMETNLTTSTEGYNLRKRLENMANLTRKLTVKEWKKACKATVGVDIREDYYMGDFYKEGLEQWISDNVDLIKTIPHDTLGRMKEIIYEGYFGGGTTTSMVEAIMKEYQSNRRHAKFIARDQVAKLNGKIQKAQQLDAGITKYKWSTVGDERVRQSHAALDGLVFEWGHPPMNDDGRACEPGEDYGCRCIGRPVFESQTLKLPVDGIEKVEVSAPTVETLFGSENEVRDFFGFRPSRAGIRKYTESGDINPRYTEYMELKEKFDSSMVGRWYNALTTKEQVATAYYTSDGFSAMNGLLRGRMTKNMVKGWEQHESQTIMEYIDNLTEAIRKFELDEDIVVHRTTEREFLDKLKVGEIFKHDNFVSCSALSKSVASGDVFWDIHVPKGKGNGAYIEILSGSEDEYEFLLQRGTKLRINSVTETSEGVKIDASVVGQEISKDIRYATKEEVIQMWLDEGYEVTDRMTEGL